MVKARQFNDPLAGPGGDERRNRECTVVARSPESCTKRQVRVFRCKPRPRGAHEHVGDAVPSRLVALAGVVQQGRHNEVRVGVATVREPTSGGGTMDDITGVLRLKECEERGRKMGFREGQVSGRRLARGLAKLIDTLSHQTSNWKMVSLTPPMSQPMGEKGVTKLITMSVIRMPIP